MRFSDHNALLYIHIGICQTELDVKRRMLRLTDSIPGAAGRTRRAAPHLGVSIGLEQRDPCRGPARKARTDSHMRNGVAMLFSCRCLASILFFFCNRHVGHMAVLLMDGFTTTAHLPSRAMESNAHAARSGGREGVFRRAYGREGRVIVRIGREQARRIRHEVQHGADGCDSIIRFRHMGLRDRQKSAAARHWVDTVQGLCILSP
jgi:hypothetical protein